MVASTHPWAEAARTQRVREETTQVALETVAEGGPTSRRAGIPLPHDGGRVGRPRHRMHPPPERRCIDVSLCRGAKS